MKFYLLIFLFTSIFVFGQDKKDLIKCNLADVKKAESIGDLIPSFPPECAIIKCEFIANVNGTVRIFEVKDPSDKLWRRILRDVTPGSILHIDVEKYACSKTLPKNYRLIVIE